MDDVTTAAAGNGGAAAGGDSGGAVAAAVGGASVTSDVSQGRYVDVVIEEVHRQNSQLQAIFSDMGNPVESLLLNDHASVEGPVSAIFLEAHRRGGRLTGSLGDPLDPIGKELQRVKQSRLALLFVFEQLTASADDAEVVTAEVEGSQNSAKIQADIIARLREVGSARVTFFQPGFFAPRLVNTMFSLPQILTPEVLKFYKAPAPESSDASASRGPGAGI